ncbi:MAG TPA: branched-chain amino acid ABC transporter permease [Firmicutes bacterium]|nr:branched-chain amino acid ABC transporter permease [Bacillota bacterium]
MTDLVDLLISGLVYGSIITVGAIGLTLMSDILDFFNFAYGDFFTLGAFTTLAFLSVVPGQGTFAGLSFGWSMVLAVLLAALVTVMVMLAFDYLFFRRLRNMGVSSLFMSIASLGVSFIIRSIIFMIWGPKVRYYSSEVQLSKEFLGISIRPDNLFILLSSLLLVAAVYYFLKSSRIGKALRSVSDNKALAQASGMQPSLMIMCTWIICGILAGVGGTLFGIQVQLNPNMGWNFLIPMFVAVIMGGIGSFWGALIGGMTIGITEELVTGLIQNLVTAMELQINVSAYKPAVAFIFVIVILLLRPYGLFGKPQFNLKR